MIKTRNKKLDRRQICTQIRNRGGWKRLKNQETVTGKGGLGGQRRDGSPSEKNPEVRKATKRVKELG